MSKYQKEIESLLSKSESGINKKLQKLYKDLAEEITQDIIKLSEEIEQDDKFSKKLQKERLESIRSQMYAKANQLAGNQEENIYDFLRHDGQVAFNELFYDFEMTEKIPLSFAMMTDKQINVIINTPVASRKLSTRLKGNNTKMKQNLNRVLTRGFAKGWSTQKMAAQIAEIGGANYRRGMTIARTESGRVTSVARQQSQQHAKEIGIKTNKRWVSTLDGDTRTNHRKLDGKTVGIDDYFEIDGHKALQPHMFGIASEDCNCRCRTITIIEGYEPDLRRDNETKEVIDYKNYNEWLESKSEELKPWQKASKNIIEDPELKQRAQDLVNIDLEAKEIYKTYREKYLEATRNNNDETKQQAEILRLKYREIYQKQLEFEKDYVENNANRVKQILGNYRELGPGNLDMKSHYANPRAQMTATIKKAYEYYPTDWIKRSTAHGAIKTKKVKRGYYSHSDGEIALSNRVGIKNSLRTAIHELAHRQEYISPDILKAEKEFYEYRTKGESLVRLKDVTGMNYSNAEVTRVDNFLNPYMGKEYPDNRAYELLTMGMDTLYAEPLKLAEDVEMFEWVVEMLLTK